jgi:ribosomal protein S18 acetylase RimI-like enzyme
MQLGLIQISEINIYVEKLNSWLKETLSFPDEAIRNYNKIWNVDFIKSNLNKAVFIGAWEKNQLIGLVLGTDIEGGVGTIIWVLVYYKFHKKGIGSELMKKSINVYKQRGAHKIKLTVPDKETVRFYEKQGMNIEGVFKNHWWNIDFWSMGKTI